MTFVVLHFGCLAHVHIVRCAAVLFIDGAVYFTDGVPNVEILDKFQNRNDRCMNVSSFVRFALVLFAGKLLRVRSWRYLSGYRHFRIC